MNHGEPLVVYHGTDADIAEFATEKEGENGMGAGLGSFFTDNADYASEYAEKLGGNVIPVILSLKNPLMINEYYGIDAISRIAFDFESNAKYGKTYYSANYSTYSQKQPRYKNKQRRCFYSVRRHGLIIKNGNSLSFSIV